MMMIHNPWNIVMGDADDLRKEAETLDKIRETLLSAYEAKTGMEREELVRLMDAETWLTAAEAVEMGFADVTTPPMMAAACVKDQPDCVGHGRGAGYRLVHPRQPAYLDLNGRWVHRPLRFRLRFTKRHDLFPL